MMKEKLNVSSNNFTRKDWNVCILIFFFQIYSVSWIEIEKYREVHIYEYQKTQHELDFHMHLLIKIMGTYS